MEIILDSPHVSDNKVRYQLHVSKNLRKYFLNDASYVQYDSDIDLENIDSSILAIPMVSLLVPIAWAVGADVHLNEIDSTYLQSLTKVEDAYRNLHPNFSFTGDIQATRTASNEVRGNRTGILFSGGVDSLTSYLLHKNENPDLISIWGLPDIPHFNKKAWSMMWTDICSIAGIDDVRVSLIKTDMLSNINRELLSKEFDLHWFAQATSGLFVLGLCAPVTIARKMATIIVASTYTEHFKGLSGSHPSINNTVSWADVRAVYHGYALSRQEKLRYLCRAENRQYLPHLRVCWETAQANNCGYCEKCMRTIAGLLAEGMNPNACNFRIDGAELRSIMNCFRKGKIALNEGQVFMWSDIQKHIPDQLDTDINGSREFLTWLRGYNLTEHSADKLRALLWEAHRLYRNRKLVAPAIVRKFKCYYYIVLSKLKFL